MGVVRRAGWQKDDENGKDVFRVVIEYREQDDPPDFPIDVVWKETQVEVVLKNAK